MGVRKSGGGPCYLDPVTDVVIVLSTFPPAEASAMARALVDEGLAACVSLAPVRSTYRWDGSVNSDEECAATIKTTRARWPALRARVLQLHPYQVPELVLLAVEDGHAPYLAWVETSATPT